MSKEKVTLSDIRERRLQTLHQLELTRVKLQQEWFALTHPFAFQRNSRRSLTFRSLVSVFKKAYMSYKVISSIVSLFKRRKR
ncbi:MAG: hypothetical protein PUD79_02880 [Prevotellaceae bacterium]|nr:hypothetical protein [Prevotellaceae bacterium]